MAFVSVGRVSAWGRLGHEIVIAIAERHLTTDTKENISKYFPYDLNRTIYGGNPADGSVIAFWFEYT